MHHHDACATLNRAPHAHETFTLAHLLRRAAGLMVLLVVLPVFLLGLAVALPVALLVGGADAVENLLRTARRQLGSHRFHRHAHL